MQFKFTPVTITAALLLLCTSSLAIPAAAAGPSHIPTPHVEGSEFINLGTPLPESETAILSASTNTTPIFEAGGRAGAIFSLIVPDDENEDPVSLDKRSYVGTCVDCSIVNSVLLQCRCRRTNGSWLWSQLNLNGCLANINSYLGWVVNGNFQNSCGGYGLSGSWFSTFCEAYPGSPLYWTEISLDQKIHNWNGILGYQP